MGDDEVAETGTEFGYEDDTAKEQNHTSAYDMNVVAKMNSAQIEIDHEVTGEPRTITTQRSNLWPRPVNPRQDGRSQKEYTTKEDVCSLTVSLETMMIHVQ